MNLTPSDRAPEAAKSISELTTFEASCRLASCGISVIPVRNNGTKEPAARWEPYQQVIADEAMRIKWFTKWAGPPALGIVCGAVSGNLEMFELEGRAKAEGYLARFVQHLIDHGMGELWKRLTDGYVVQSPSGGWHIYYRVTDGEVKPNTKLASRPSTPEELATHKARQQVSIDAEADQTKKANQQKVLDELTFEKHPQVLIETRGEGGYVIAPPSNGATHPSGQAWTDLLGTPELIPGLSADERDALHAIAQLLDSMPQKAPQARAESKNIGGRPGDHFNAVMTWEKILVVHGWTKVYQDPNGLYATWRRPGKDWGISATTGRTGDDRLYVFSSSTPFETENPYTKYAAYAVLNHDSDYAAAARALRKKGYGDESMLDLFDGILGEAEKPVEASDLKAGTEVQPSAEGLTAPAETLLLACPGVLPDEFWSARPVLSHIRQAAHSRGRSAEAVLGAVLARIAADTHHRIKLPPIVGGMCGLSLIVALTGKPGTGKSTAKLIAMELVPRRLLDAACDDIPPGSGEGMLATLFDMEEEIDMASGKKVKVNRQNRYNAFVYVDEGEVLAKQANRDSSNTIMPILRSVFTDSTLGQANATEERKRRIASGNYVFGILIGIQPNRAAAFFDDAGGGTPQRFLWSPTQSPTPPRRERPPWPGVLPRPGAPRVVIGERGCMEIEVAEAVAEEIAEADHVRQQQGSTELDEHAVLIREKVAAILGLLDGRTSLSEDDWRLAGMVMASSDAVRADVLESIKVERAALNTTRAVAEAERIEVVQQRTGDAAVKRVCQTIVRKLTGSEAALSRGNLRRALTSSDRDDCDVALDRLMDANIITVDDDGRYLLTRAQS